VSLFDRHPSTATCCGATRVAPARCGFRTGRRDNVFLVETVFRAYSPVLHPNSVNSSLILLLNPWLRCHSGGIGSRRPERRANLPYPEAPHATIEACSIAAVAIMSQKSRWRSMPFHDLLCGPARCRMPRQELSRMAKKMKPQQEREVIPKRRALSAILCYPVWQKN